MRYFLLVLLGVLTLKTVSAQDELMVPFVAYWNVGDSKNYKVTKKNVRFKNNIETENQTTVYEMKCTVVDSSEFSYTLEWEYQNTLMNTLEIPQEIQNALDKYKLVKVIYTTNEVGVFQEILNWEEFRNMTNDMLDKLVELNMSTNKNFAKVIEPIKKIYSSKESITSLILKEIQIFHFPLGVEFNAMDTLKYEELLPNLMGGEPIKGNGTVYFENINMDKGTAKFINQLKLDENDARRVVGEVMKSFVKNLSFSSKKEKEKTLKEVNDEFSKMEMDIQDYNVFNYYFNPGWPIHIHTKRTSVFSGQNESGLRIDEVIIEEIE